MTIVVGAIGGGVNSTAMLIGMWERGEKVDLNLFADTGGEKPHTYQHIGEFNRWLLDHGMPDIRRVARHTTISKREDIGTYTTLEEDCLAKSMLPSIAYGYKACSQKYKREPQDKFCNSYEPCLAEWAAGRKVIKLIGYDADEPQRANIKEDEKYTYRYPLIEWNWGRDECEEAIARVGLKTPGKSSCFFCPSSKKHEIFELRRVYPDLARRAVAMERGAEQEGMKCSCCNGDGIVRDLEAALTGNDECPRCSGTGREPSIIKGLGRNFAWRDLYEADDRQAKLFPETLVQQDCMCVD